MKLVVIFTLLTALVGVSLAGQHVPAEFGACPEDEYRGKIKRYVIQSDGEMAMTFDTNIL